MRTVIALLLAAFLTNAHAVARTDTARLTTDGNNGNAVFSPQGDRVAYLHYDAQDETTVRVWQKGGSRDLIEVKGKYPRLHWLTGGDWLLIRQSVNPVGGTLLRVADGWNTRVAKQGNWYVTNDAVALPKKVKLDLNKALRDTYITWYSPKRRPADVDLPTESDDYEYGRWDVAPNTRWAVCELQDKHFADCACSSGYQKTFIGLWRDRRMKRLTWSENGQQVSPRISPDERYIAYKLSDWYAVDEAADWAHLRLLTPDGRVRRRLALDVDHLRWFVWLDARRILAVHTSAPVPPNAEAKDDTYPAQQLSIVYVPSGKRRGLTKGDFRHELLDVHGDKFLVAEHPVGRRYVRIDGDHLDKHDADLYIIRPRK